ncbi:hypothetical protein MASR1M60_15690 [Rhodocyclaceae bacterium]
MKRQQAAKVKRAEVGQATRLIPGRLNVVVRLHDPDKLEILSQCLLMLFGQDYDHIQPVIVLQGFGTPALRQVQAEIDQLPWLEKHPDSRPLVINCPNPQRRDLRARLLNLGVERSTGQYLAFLDYEDFIYGNAYTYLIGRLQSIPDVALSFGRIILTKGVPCGDYDYHESKNFSLDGQDKYDLFHSNFCAIHSYVIDRKRAPADELYFDETIPMREDTEFLVRLLARCEGDFEARRQTIGEYLIKTDGSNTVTTNFSTSTPAQRRREARAEVMLDRLYEKTRVSMRVADIRKLKQAVIDARPSMPPLPVESITLDRPAQDAQTAQINSLNRLIELLIRNAIAQPSLLSEQREVVLECEVFKRSQTHCGVRGWCIDVATKQFPEVMFLCIGRHIFLFKADIVREDLVERLGVRKAFGFEFVAQIFQSQNPAEEGSYYLGAVFSHARIHVRPYRLDRVDTT